MAHHSAQVTMDVHIHRTPKIQGKSSKALENEYEAFDDDKPKEECGVFGYVTVSGFF